MNGYRDEEEPPKIAVKIVEFLIPAMQHKLLEQ